MSVSPVSKMASDLYLPLSQVRLESYRPANGSDLDMLVNYFWDIDLTEALVPALHAIELALRNTINATLESHFGTDMWFYQQGVLDSGQLSEFAKALGRVAKKPPLSAGKLVAELNFGFWVTMLSGPYEQRIWQPNSYALFHAAFPHAVGKSKKQVYDRLNDIRQLRNRIFHYEAIWNRANLRQEHADIHEATGWISPTFHQAIHAVDNFLQILGGRANVEAGLKKHLGMP